MKLCNNCIVEFPSDQNECPNCGSKIKYDFKKFKLGEIDKTEIIQEIVKRYGLDEIQPICKIEKLKTMYWDYNTAQATCSFNALKQEKESRTIYNGGIILLYTRMIDKWKKVNSLFYDIKTETNNLVKNNKMDKASLNRKRVEEESPEKSEDPSINSRKSVRSLRGGLPGQGRRK